MQNEPWAWGDEGYTTCKFTPIYQNYSRVEALERLNYFEYDLLADVATGIRYTELNIMTQNPTPVDGISGYGDGAIHRFMYSPFIGREHGFYHGVSVVDWVCDPDQGFILFKLRLLYPTMRNSFHSNDSDGDF